jgi:DNA polymerase-3 subunit gamma/tau
VLEEPPPRVVFVFATTEPQKIAQTAAPVLSRLQRFDLKRIGPAEIRERLALVLAEEGVTAEPEALAMIARAADGGLRDALSLTDQVLSLGQSGEVTAERVREALGLVAEDEYVALLDVLAQRRAGDVFATVARLADAGVDFAQFLGGLADVLRAQLAIILGGATPDLSDRLRTALEERRADFAAADMLRMLGALTELEPRFRRSAQQRLLLETLLVRFALLDRTVSLEEVLRGLGNGGGAPAPSAAGRGGAPAFRPPAAPGVEAGAAPRADARAEPGADFRAGPPADVRPPAPPPPPPAPSPEPRGERPRSPDAAAAPATRFAPETDAPPRLEDFAPIDDAPARGMPRAAPGAAAGGALPDVNRLAERWDDVAAELRRAGQALLASQLANALPVAVSAAGVVTVQPEDDMTETAIDRKKDDVLAALRAVFPGVERLAVRRAEGTAAPAQRLTAEAVRAEKMNTLRRRDPALGAAIDALDLELLE